MRNGKVLLMRKAAGKYHREAVGYLFQRSNNLRFTVLALAHKTPLLNPKSYLRMCGSRGAGQDIIGRAYEYLIKKFADDAGAKAGEFFTPPEVVDTLVRILEPKPGDTVYDPTSGSGGMLVHCADYLREQGHRR